MKKIMKLLDCTPYKMPNKNTKQVDACKCHKHALKLAKNIKFIDVFLKTQK